MAKLKSKGAVEKNIFLEVEYLGTNYFGFQVQTKKAGFEPTVQEVLEKSIRKLFKESIRIAYAGRTDRGVHAKAQAVNFKAATAIPLANIKTALNAFLPADIRIKKVKLVPGDFHARFSAKTKVYRYLIVNRKEPTVFWNNLAWQVSEPLDILIIQRLSRKLTGRRDFSLFAKDAKSYKDCFRTIKSISIKKKGSLISIDIEGDGFLRNMVRNLISFLLKAARGKLSFSDAEAVLAGKASYLNHPAPACGLYLVKVNYCDR
jgi:tRNA pseudouridine38-40 synthase